MPSATATITLPKMKYVTFTWQLPPNAVLCVQHIGKAGVPATTTLDVLSARSVPPPPTNPADIYVVRNIAVGKSVFFAPQFIDGNGNPGGFEPNLLLRASEESVCTVTVMIP